MNVRSMLFVLAFASACTGELSPLALSEPVRVPLGTWREGALPGTAPLALGEETPEGVPLVTSIESASGIATPGQLGRLLTGRTTEDAYALGIRFAELGTGYWVVPVGAIDPAAASERIFAVSLDLGPVPPGVHRLRIVAIDGDGKGGPATDLPICVLDPAVPGNLAPCSDTIAPPAAVVSLTWDEDVDLDLVVRTPEGKLVDGRRPTTASPESVATVDPSRDPTLGVFTTDSNRDCVIDGRNTESIVWREAPVDGGTFLAYANLYSACGQRSVRFSMTLYRREDVDGVARLVEAERRTGVLLSAAANGGAGNPLYVLSIAF